eukprot:TRINITY_DN3376_c1_g1_i1.p1 TRINITY_DN3376_c1_g1~~TRINITY_DN3376_c1_g1_i1.p1  ORF type:complete len:545 (+),score=115.03 TRINITY_DN3376_c1_g1_i1:55-1635(+)
MTATVTHSRRVWQQLVDTVTHTVVGDGGGGGSVGRVPEAFEVFHLDVEGAGDVARALDAVKGSIGNGLYIGIYSGSPETQRGESYVPIGSVPGGHQQRQGGQSQQHSLLELWCIKRVESDVHTPSRQSQNNTRTEQVALRLLLRSIYMGCRLLPLGPSRSAKKKLGYFLAPIDAYDPKTGVLQPGQAATSMGDSFEGHARFEGLQEQRKWRPVTVGSQNSPYTVSVSVTHSTGVPEVGEPAQEPTASVSIIGDYVNVGEASGVLHPPFSRPKQQQGVAGGNLTASSRTPSASIPIQRSYSGVRFSKPMAISRGTPHGAHGAGATQPQSTPPPFALTPTPSSLQSASSFNKVFGKGTDGFSGRCSVSPPDGSQHWVPKFEQASTGNWAPKNDDSMQMTATVSHAIPQGSLTQQDMAPFMAFLEEDDLDGPASDLGSEDVSHGGMSLGATAGGRGAHGDDDVARFRERMESVSLVSGFSTHGGTGSYGDTYGRGSFSASCTAPPQRTVRDFVHHMEEMRSEYVVQQAS